MENKYPNQSKGIALSITAASLWGIMGIFVRYLSAAGYSSADLSCLRCLLAGVAYFFVLLVRRRSVLKVTLGGLLICMIYGASTYGVCFFTYNVAVERIPVAVATVLMFMCPIWVTILGMLVFREKPKKVNLVAILVCMIGAVLVADLIHVEGGGMDPVGILASVVNGFGMALQIMIPRYFAKRFEKDTMLVYGFLGAGLALAFLSDFGRMGTLLVTGNTFWIIVNILASGILCTLVSNGSYVKATSYADTTTVSIFSAMEVVVGSAVGVVIFHESMSALQVLGAVVIVLGALGPGLLEKWEARKARSHAV